MELPGGKRRPQLGRGHVTQLDGDPHKKRRQQLKPGFKMEAVMRYLPQMNQVATELLPTLCDQPINITEAFAELILMITARTTFRCELSPEMVATMSHWEHDFIYGTSLRWRRHFYYGRPIYRRMRKEAVRRVGTNIGRTIAIKRRAGRQPNRDHQSESRGWPDGEPLGVNQYDLSHPARRH